MAVKSEKQINSFIRGLITESNPLTFPENASLDEANFILNRDGSRERRLGIDYEDDYVINSTGTSVVNASSFHEWKISGKGVDVSIGVIRIYNQLWFINMLDRAPSSALLNQGNPIEIPQLRTAPIHTAIVNNTLVLVSHDIPKPYRLVYDKTNDIVTAVEYTVFVRDFWGVNDALLENQRPSELTNLHRYNLKNQGWADTIQTTCSSPNDKNAIECTKTTIGVYPSNADNWTLGKIADSSSANYEKYSPTEMVKRTHDFMPAPKGKFIIDVFNRGESRSSISGVTTTITPGSDGYTPNSIIYLFPHWDYPFWEDAEEPTPPTTVTLDYTDLPLDKESGSFSAVAAFAGRVFYSGVRSDVVDGDAKSPNYSGYVFFSQTLINDEKLAKCYQEADPTSPDISDIVATDGGAIHIVDAINIVALVPTKSMLLVFAENGVWQISGGEANFDATSYEVYKISSIGCGSSRTIVPVNNEVFYWSKGGIFRIVFDDTDGGLKSENLSLTSVQSLYNEIPEKGRQFATGMFEEKENTVRWLYNDSLVYQGDNKYNKELILDLTLGAFYLFELDDSAVYIADFINIPDYSESQGEEEVFVKEDLVITTDLSDVVINTIQAAQREGTHSYLTILPTEYTVEGGGGCDTEASAFITLESDPYSNQFFYNTITNEVWRVNYPSGGSNYIFQRYDGTTGAYIADTAPVATFWDEYEVLFVEATSRIYAQDGSGGVVILDAADGSLVGSESSGVYLFSLDPYTDTIWCGDYTESSNLVKLNADGTRAATYALDAGSTSFLGGITFSEDYVWVADYNNPRMYRVAKSDGSVTEYDTSGVLGAGAEVNHIAYDATRDCIWAFDAASVLRKFDLATNTFTDSWTYTGTFQTHPNSSGISFNSHIGLYNSELDKIILTSTTDSKLLIIDPDDPNTYTELSETLTYDYLAYYVENGCIYFWVSDAIKKYCCTASVTYPRGWTVSKLKDTTFTDWKTYDSVGKDFTSYLVTGYEIFGEMMRKKQIPYIFFYFERTEDGFDENLNLENQSSCYVQAQWNWADSANSGKWGAPFQAYRLTRPYIPTGPSDTFNYGDRVVVTKNKLRGSGRAISLKIYSESGKDMKLLGWAFPMTGNTTV